MDLADKVRLEGLAQRHTYANTAFVCTLNLQIPLKFNRMHCSKRKKNNV